MILIDKDGTKYKSDGKFHTLTIDWNCDGDIYADTVMRIDELESNNYTFIHKYDLIDYQIIEE